MTPRIRIPGAYGIDSYKKNPFVYNRKFDQEVNPITNWPDDMIHSEVDTDVVPEWWTYVNEGRNGYTDFYFRIFRKMNCVWLWMPYTATSRTESEALGCLEKAVGLKGFVSIGKEEYDYVLKEALIMGDEIGEEFIEL
jgi:hypothetical protein